MSKKRVFVALKMSDILQSKIMAWEKDFSKTNSRAYKLCRWLKPDNLHITLIPPWYIGVDDIDKLKDNFNSVTQSGPIEVNFNSISFGPEQKRPRLVWASGRTPPELVDLKSRLEKQLEINPEKRAFKLHLTLARFKEDDFKSFGLKELKSPINWHDQLGEIVLLESKLALAGAEYSELGKVKI